MDTDHDHAHHSHDHGHHGHSHGPARSATTCGHAHAPDPSMLEGRPLRAARGLVGDHRGRPAALLRRADRPELRAAERALSRRRALGLRHVDRHGDHRLGAGDAGRHRQGVWPCAMPQAEHAAMRISNGIEISGALLVLVLGVVLLGRRCRATGSSVDSSEKPASR